MEKLDTGTGVTVTFSAVPMLLYREEPGRAAYARSYLQLGPIKVNRSGDYRYFLWLGIWNTMQDPDPAASRDGFESIVLFVDGEPLPLEVRGWMPATIGASERTYVKPVASAIDAYYEVTADQVRLIAGAHDLRLVTGGAAPRHYEMWDGQESAQQSLQIFAQKI